MSRANDLLQIFELGIDARHLSGRDDGLFIQRKKLLGNTFKDFRKSKEVSRDWKHDRASRMSAIKDYHQSSTGKKFHRDLGTWLSTRYFIPKEGMLGLSLDKRGLGQ